MRSLTQCWFTRAHQPQGRGHKEADGSQTSWCRHCERAIVSWDKRRWFLSDGFNVTRLAESVSGRFVFLLDTSEELVIARYPVGHLTDPDELAALKDDLRARHGVGEPGSTVELHDSGEQAKRSPARRAPPGTGPSFAIN